MDIQSGFLQEIKELKKSIECFVCNKVSTNILISSCEHIFCENCVNILLKRRIVRCPKCKNNLSRQKFYVNSRISNLIDCISNFQLHVKTNDEKQTYVKEKTYSELNLTVNQSDIEKYMKENLEACEVILDDDKSTIVQQINNTKQSKNENDDDLLSISQVPAPIQEDTKYKINSPIKLPISRVKTIDKVTTWLNSHTSVITEPISETNDIDAVHQVTQCKDHNTNKNDILFNRSNTKDSEINESNVKKTISKINLKHSVNIENCLENVNVRPVTKNISEICENKLTSDSSKNNFKVNTSSLNPENIESKLSCDLFTCNELKSHISKKVENKQTKQICNINKKERKTFSLEANTEDLQKIQCDNLENTQDALTPIFNDRGRAKLTTETTNSIQKNNNNTCKFIKAHLIKHIKSFKPIQKPILFFLKGKLDVPKILYENKGVQYSNEEYLQEKKYSESRKKMVHVFTQTNLTDYKNDFNCVSETELDDNDDINIGSPEITVVCNLPTEFKTKKINSLPNVNISTEGDIKTNEYCKTSKRKREKDGSLLLMSSPSPLRSTRNDSSSSDSDIQSCLKPVKSVQLLDMSDDDIPMMEDMTVKFTSIQDSENSECNIIKKRKVQCLNSSSNSSSYKENRSENVLLVENDSEPINYDEILSTVFANIDSELHSSKDQESIKPIIRKKENPSIINNNSSLLTNCRTPTRQLSSEVTSKSNNLFSSTPNNKSNIRSKIDKKPWDVSINTFDNTSNIDKIVGAIESNYLENELNRSHQEIFTTEIELEKSKYSEYSTKERCSSRTSLLQTTLKSNSLKCVNDAINASHHEKKKSIIDPLNETFTSTIVDHPKENTEPYTSNLNKTNDDLLDMEISSPLDKSNTIQVGDLQKFNTNTVPNSFPNLGQNTDKNLDSDIDYVPSSMEVKPFCIACSCLIPEDVALVKKFANKFSLKFVMQYEESVTHLIVRVNKENCGERSLKFINAMVHGAWVLNKQWIHDCLSSETLLTEFKYEVLDISLEPGPKRNRQALPKSLLINIKVFVIGPFHSTCVNEIKSLIEKAGASIQSNHTTAQLIVLDEGEHSKEDIESIYRKSLKPIVDMTWFLDCICRGRLVKISDHILFPHLSQMKQEDYPTQLFQDTEII